MAWDKTLPDGSVSIAQGDNDIRSNNDALESAFDLEHRFTTGGNQSGRHAFVVDTTSNINALSDLVQGAIAIDTDARPTGSLKYYDGSSWQFADIGTGDVPRLDENSQFTAAQEAQWLSISPVASALAIDMSLQSAQYSTISGNVTISNPTNAPTAGYTTQILLQLTMSGAGHTISWGTSYRAANGVAPLYDDTSGAINFFVLTVMQSGVVLVTSLPNVGTF